ncbi:hypothetical protein FIM08_04635, partial [SAR202 cluster bacterium AC-647-N09_OGT_505m]|nr:hypothetical protein [SAR202 cluster bacterium AC-647-N09_OGT_505m]
LGFTTQPAGPSAGTFGTQPVVAVQDVEGNTFASSSAAVTLAVTSGDGTLIGTTTLNAVNGVATFTDLVINTADDGYVLTAISSGLTSATSEAFNLAIGTAAQLVYTTQPADSTSGELLSTQPVVAIQDGAGNVVTDSSATVTLTLSSGTLSGTTTLNAINGIATFTDISVSTTGAGLALTASSIGLTSATSSSFAVLAGDASAVSVVTQPGNATSGTAFTTQPVIHIVDAQGNLTASPGNVTSTISGGTGDSDANLSGTTTVAAVDGIATFTNLSIDKAASGYTLTFSVSGLTGAVSSSFTITPGAASTLQFSTQPVGERIGRRLQVQPVVTITDSLGNIVASTASISLSLTTGVGTAGATLGGTTTVSAVNGVATLVGLRVDLLGQGYTITAASSGLASGVSLPFTMSGIGEITTQGLRSIDYVSAYVGWAVGASGTIMMTNDGGRSWSLQTSGTTSQLMGIDFVDYRYGWAVGAGGTVLATTNGGHTWTPQTSGTTETLHRVQFRDASNGSVVGVNGLILRTTDGGNTWSSINSGSSRNLRGISYGSSTVLTVVGDQGEVLRSTDGGSSWSAQTSGTSRNLRGVSLSDASNGWAVGADGRVLRTQDGGSSWSEQTVLGEADLNAVRFVDSNRGWAVGAGGAIARTTDGGASWSNITSGTSEDLHSVSFVSNPEGGAVGTNGTILRSEDAGSTWSVQNGVID